MESQEYFESTLKELLNTAHEAQDLAQRILREPSDREAEEELASHVITLNIYAQSHAIAALAYQFEVRDTLYDLALKVPSEYTTENRSEDSQGL
ncbi:MAG: hypothetical protein ACMXYM_03715 [Candidatus Woesearchaeota archaeon]